MMLMMIAMMMKAATSNKVRLNGLLSGERWYRRASIAFACPPSFSPPSFSPPSFSPPSFSPPSFSTPSFSPPSFSPPSFPS